MKNLGTKTITTERLILRPFTLEDATSIYEGFRNQDGFLYFANKDRVTLEEEIKSLENISSKYNNKDYYNWLITLKDNTVIGAINLNVFTYNDSVEFNYAIDEKYQNKGYMTEALKEIKTFCLNELEANRFFGGCAVNNPASSSVMEKCGLSYEGTLKENLKLRDGYHDMKIYALIRNKD